MGDGCAEHGLGPGREQTVGGAAQGCSGGADVVDEEYAVTPHPPVGREAPARQLFALRAGPPRLSAKTVASQDPCDGSIDSPRYLVADETSRARSSAKTTEVVGRDRGDHGDLVEPGRDGDPCRQTTAQGPCDLIVASVFEGENREPKNPVVLAP